MPFATTWMDLEGNMLSEISQMEKDKILFGVTFMCKKIQQTLSLFSRPVTTYNSQDMEAT